MAQDNSNEIGQIIVQWLAATVHEHMAALLDASPVRETGRLQMTQFFEEPALPRSVCRFSC